MTEKRYLLKKWLGYDPYYIDTKQEYVDEAELRFELDGYKAMSDEQVVSLLNENEQLSHDATVLIQSNTDYRKENEELKQQLNEAVNQIHLVHMKSMFSTVQSFKGDVSKRYKYSKEYDTIYDTANHYGQYDKVLDKAEIVMLLNEYETVLNELKGDV